MGARCLGYVDAVVTGTPAPEWAPEPARRRLVRLGVLRRRGRWWVATLVELQRKLPELFYSSQPNRDELQQLQHEITDLRREMRRTRAELRKLREMKGA